MRLGAYQAVVDFAYPGWRLSVPGGPAGGHYKGFTHTQAAGTTILPQDQYEEDRGDGMSSHDAVHASHRNPRGVYRSSGEVPPRPNASGSAHTYRSLQTRHHPGEAVSPGSFPADFHDTGEDDFLSLAENAPHYFTPGDVASSFLGAVRAIEGDGPIDMPPIYGRPIPRSPIIVVGTATAGPTTPPPTSPGTFTCPGGDCSGFAIMTPAQPAPPASGTIAAPSCPSYGAAPSGEQWLQIGTDANGCPVYEAIPLTGATSIVPQPPGTLAPAPPAPAVPVYTAPPVSPAPSPVVGTNEVIPLNDGSGNYLNLSTGQVIPASAVMQNPATGQLVQTSAAVTPFSTAGIMSWLEEPSSIFPSIPNWGFVAAAAVGASLLLGRHRR